MPQSQILDVVTAVVRTVLDDEDVVLTPETLIRSIPEWDSLNNMHIVVRVEKKLGLDFQQSDFDNVASVGDFLNLIQSQLKD